MSEQVDLYNSTYGNFEEQVLSEIRQETYGEDIGQNSWITTDEYDTFYSWLNLSPDNHLLEIASGSGGPAVYLARKFQCRVTGLDINPEGINTATQKAQAANLSNVNFRLADVTQPLPFDPKSFDAVMCTDSANHFHNRLAVLGEWHRVLKSGKRILFTDPVVITGAVSNEELAARSNIGFFIFMPLEVTKRYIQEAGFQLLRCEDVTGNIELTSGRWHDSRRKHRADLIKIEGEERFEGLQKFLSTVHKLTHEQRLSRFVCVPGRKIMKLNNLQRFSKLPVDKWHFLSILCIYESQVMPLFQPELGECHDEENIPIDGSRHPLDRLVWLGQRRERMVRL